MSLLAQAGETASGDFVPSVVGFLVFFVVGATGGVVEHKVGATYQRPTRRGLIRLAFGLLTLPTSVWAVTGITWFGLVVLGLNLLVLGRGVRDLASAKLARRLVASRQVAGPQQTPPPADPPSDAASTPPRDGSSPIGASPAGTSSDSRSPVSPPPESSVGIREIELASLVRADLMTKPRRPAPDDVVDWIKLGVEALRMIKATDDATPKMRTLFLWVFAEQPSQALVDAAQEWGPVYFLRGGGALVSGIGLGVLLGDTADHIEETEAEVLAKLEQFDEPKRFEMREHTMLCGDGVWMFALDQLIARTDTVVMDLSAFDAGHAGCEYELGVIIDRIPLDRVVLTTGPRTDRTALRTVLDERWHRMAAQSPNRGSDAPITIAHSDALLDPDRREMPSDPSDDPRPLTRAEREREGFRKLLATVIGQPERDQTRT